MKQTEARNRRNKIAQSKRRENGRSQGFNEQNKILPLLANRGEGELFCGTIYPGRHCVCPGLWTRSRPPSRAFAFGKFLSAFPKRFEYLSLRWSFNLLNA